MYCSTCNQPIPQERLDALPGTTTCVNCSTVKKKEAYNVYQFSKGTAPELVLVDPSNVESIRRARRANKRSR